MESSAANLAGQLKNKQIRPSFQRVKVLEYLTRAGGHPTVDEIYTALLPENPSLSKVTVYNTLHTFVKAGLVREVEIDAPQKRYDITVHDHGHFQCTACAAIYNFAVRVELPDGETLGKFVISDKNVYFKGLCPNCAAQAAETNKE